MSKKSLNQFTDYTSDHPVGGCLGLIVAILLVIFLGPWIVMHAWYLIAVCMFGLPAMPYWTAFFGTWAVHILLQQVHSKSDD